MYTLQLVTFNKIYKTQNLLLHSTIHCISIFHLQLGHLFGHIIYSFIQYYIVLSEMSNLNKYDLKYLYIIWYFLVNGYYFLCFDIEAVSVTCSIRWSNVLCLGLAVHEFQKSVGLPKQSKNYNTLQIWVGSGKRI